MRRKSKTTATSSWTLKAGQRPKCCRLTKKNVQERHGRARTQTYLQPHLREGEGEEQHPLSGKLRNTTKQMGKKKQARTRFSR